MSMKYIYVMSILIIVVTSLGCVDKPTENVSQENTPAQVVEPTTTQVTNIVGTTENEPITTTNVSDTDIQDNESSPDNVSAPENISTPENVSTPEGTEVPTPGATDMPIEDVSVTKIFKIGDENNMLGVNVRLVNITDYDNNSAIINIDGVDYEYSPDLETSIQVKGVEILDVISSEGDKTAEITVDYI